MAKQVGKLHSLLFEEGRTLENIKFFPGDSRGLTADVLAGAASESIRRALDNGLHSNPPMSGRAKRKLEVS